MNFSRHLSALPLALATVGAVYGWDAYRRAPASYVPKTDYALAAPDVYRRLMASDFADFMYDRQCGVLIHIKAEGDSDRAITWTIASSGKPQFRFTAQLTPIAANRTRVDIAVSPEPNGREAYDGDQMYRRPAVLQPVRPAIDEQIAALLDGKPYDSERARIGSDDDGVCKVQRGGLEQGLFVFSVDDPPDGPPLRREGKVVQTLKPYEGPPPPNWRDSEPRKTKGAR